jgi:hypothetical protein
MQGIGSGDDLNFLEDYAPFASAAGSRLFLVVCFDLEVGTPSAGRLLRFQTEAVGVASSR